MLPKRTQLLSLMSYQVRDPSTYIDTLCMFLIINLSPRQIVDIESPDFDVEKYIAQLEKQEAK